MTPLVFRTTAAIEFDVLAAAPLRVEMDEDAAAASEVEVKADCDNCCCWMYNGITEEDGALVEDARETKEGLFMGILLIPQIDFGNPTRSSLSSFSPAWATPDSEDALVVVIEIIVESVCPAWECEGASLRARWLETLDNGF
jgi:hypothetical protein